MSDGGKWMSSLDLYRSHPVLIVGPRGHHWLDVGAQLATEFRLDIHHIAADADRSAQAFLQAHGISETGAILIRPDGFVARRARPQEAQPVEELSDALGHVLAPVRISVRRDPGVRRVVWFCRRRDLAAYDAPPIFVLLSRG
jgi:putative polyketide hydroxylase